MSCAHQAAWTEYLGIIPSRFAGMDRGMDRMFAMCRGMDGATALSKSMYRRVGMLPGFLVSATRFLIN